MVWSLAVELEPDRINEISHHPTLSKATHFPLSELFVLAYNCGIVIFKMTDSIRSWTNTTLHIFGMRNPSYP